MVSHAARIKPVYTLLVNKYYFDEAYQWLFAAGARRLGTEPLCRYGARAQMPSSGGGT